MKTTDTEKIEKIIKPANDELFIKCACHAEGLLIVADHDDLTFPEKTFYLSYWRYGRERVHSLSTRISRAWNILVGKGYEADEVILDEKGAYQLREFITRHLADRDLIETLRKENDYLQLELMKFDASSAYDRGYDNGQESMLVAVKKYFNAYVEGIKQTGSSRLTSLLDAYLRKVKQP